MLLNYLKYRYVKARMIAYLDGELSVETRRFIARQIDENPRCQREYLLARQTRETLKSELPTFGKPQTTQLDNLWANIQAELAQPDPIPVSRRVHRSQYSLSYGVAMLIVTIIIMMPFALDVSRSVPIPIQQQPMPETTQILTSSVAVTPEAPSTSVVYAETYTQTQPTISATIPLQNTPAPLTPRS